MDCRKAVREIEAHIRANRREARETDWDAGYADALEGVAEMIEAERRRDREARKAARKRFDEKKWRCVELLLERRLQRAEAFWQANPNATVGEAAFAAGFSDQFYFSRVFRRRRGVGFAVAGRGGRAGLAVRPALGHRGLYEPERLFRALSGAPVLGAVMGKQEQCGDHQHCSRCQ